MRYTVLDGVKGLSTADIQYANMEDATGLLGNEFAQADVTGAKLPDDIKEFKALEIVEKTSQNARKIFFGMLLVCVYSWLTIATTTDVRLLTNTASSPLPIIGTGIPIAWFYIAAPLVLICLYFYFHLYLDNLWEGLASLPAIFPDGKRLDQRAYPWLLNTLVRKHFKRLKKRSFIARMKEWITIFLSWWVVPITLIAFWLRYIPRHEWKGTIFHILLIVLSFAFGIIFYRMSALTLQGKEKVSFRLKEFWGDRRFYYGVIVVVVGVIFSLASYGAIEGVRSEYYVSTEIRKFVPWAFKKLGYDVFADFSENDVSTKPFNYWALTDNNQLKSVVGANLKGRNLSNANMNRAFLVQADLRETELIRAELNFANLEQAKLAKANLQLSKLSQSNLQQANFVSANLNRANLVMANLQQANFWHSNLQQALLSGANINGANLALANLQESNFIGANLKEAYLVGANLQGAFLSKANLQEANFGEANLQGASLKDAVFENAYLISTDLRGVKNLKVDQLSKAKTLYKAKLNPELIEQVKECCPQLLDEPNEEVDKELEKQLNRLSIFNR
jgi:uncharacterized protein YjbI with pentapeptide repeats